MRHTTVQGLRKDGNGYFGIISDNPVAYVEDLTIERLNKDLTRTGVIEYDENLEGVLSDGLKLKQFLARQKNGKVNEDYKPVDIKTVRDEVKRSLLEELPGCLKEMVLITVPGGRNTTLLIVRSLINRMLNESEYARNGQVYY